MKSMPMLKPSIQDLRKNVHNRYLLVNMAALRAREIAQAAEDAGESLDNKPVTMALCEIAEGSTRVVKVAEELPAKKLEYVSTMVLDDDAAEGASVEEH